MKRTAELTKLAEDIEKRATEGKIFQNKGRKNVYQCNEVAGHIIVTVDLETGTTPFTTECVHCRRLNRRPRERGFYAFAEMLSMTYNVCQSIKPTHEWYRPDDLLRENSSTKEHVRKGGLLLRRIGVLPLCVG